MGTYQEYYDDYYNRIKQNMDPISVENMPEVHELAVAIQNLVRIKMANYDYELQLRQYETRMLQIFEQAAKTKSQEHHHHHHHNKLVRIFYTIGKIAAMGAVAALAPGLLPELLPFVGAAGTLSNVAATGVAVASTDAAAQEIGIGLGVQDHFSFAEFLESAVSGGVLSGTADLGIIPRTAVVGVADAGTQAAEIALKMREKFDAKALGLQIASSIISSGISKVMPEIAEAFGNAEGAKIAATAANTAINSVLQSNVTGTPIDITNIAANVIGVIAGNKIGNAVTQAASTQKPLQSTEVTPVESDLDLLKPNLDKMCPIPANDSSYLERLKMTPMSPLPSTDDAVQLIMQGKFEEAKALTIEKAKTNYTPIPLPEEQPKNKDTADSLSEIDSASRVSSTADILAKMANAQSGKPYSVLDSATPFEKSILIGLGVTASVTLLPEALVAAVGTITTAFATGAVTEVVLLDTLANPVFLQAASRLGVLFGDAAAAIKSGFFESKTARVIENLPENTIYHSVKSASEGNSVLKGINARFFKNENRFGEALYTSINPETTVAELNYHTSTARFTIRYEINQAKTRVLDLTDPKIAKKWGYLAEDTYETSKFIGQKAKDAGYNMIRYKSKRAQGDNLAILSDFDTLLKPKMIVPSLEAKVASKVVSLKSKSNLEEKVSAKSASLRL